MIIKNGLVFGKDCRFERRDLYIDAGRIVASDLGDGECWDAEGCYVLPGLVDIHTHGAATADFCDGTRAALEKIARFQLSCGVTSFVGTSMTYDEQTLSQSFAAAREFIAAPPHGCARLLGINMEGPFFSVNKRGAQNPAFLRAPDIDFFQRLDDISGNNVCLVDLAPELPGAAEFIAAARARCTVSIAHTESDYDTAVAAFAAGASHVTHLFNAMPPFTHRAPGVVGAAFEHAAGVELICDGVHVHPAAVRSVFAWFGAERVCIISDSMRACGMKDGEYDLGGQSVNVSGRRATLADGTIAGSVTPLSEGLRSAVSFGVPLETAVRAATLNPAREIGRHNEVGSLEPGCRADILVWDKQLAQRRVYLGGQPTAE